MASSVIRRHAGASSSAVAVVAWTFFPSLCSSSPVPDNKLQNIHPNYHFQSKEKLLPLFFFSSLSAAFCSSSHKMWMKTGQNEVFTLLRFCCCFDTIAPPWSRLFLPALLFLWLPSPSIHHREYISQCCFCFDLLFFPNFPPSLPRALSYSQDIKVIKAKDLIKALLSQNTTTSHSALLFFYLWFISLWFPCLFLFFFSLSVFVSGFCIVLLCSTSILFVLFVCLSGYIIPVPVFDSHTRNTQMTQKKMHTTTHTLKWKCTHLHTLITRRCVTPVLSCIHKPDIYVCVNLASCCPSVFCLHCPVSLSFLLFLSFFTSSWALLGSDTHCLLISLSDCQPHCLFCDRGMPNRGIKYSLWRHAANPAVLPILCALSICLPVVFSHGFNLWSDFFHWPHQRNPYFWGKQSFLFKRSYL